MSRDLYETVMIPVLIVFAICAFGAIAVFGVFSGVARYAIDKPKFEYQLNSNPALIEAEVKSDTGSAIILEDLAGNRIIVGNVDTDKPDDIGYNERAKAYIESIGVERGDIAIVEKRGDFYSNVRKLESE